MHHFDRGPIAVVRPFRVQMMRGCLLVDRWQLPQPGQLGADLGIIEAEQFPFRGDDFELVLPALLQRSQRSFRLPEKDRAMPDFVE